MDLDNLMSQFRLASRDLFNQYYRVADGTGDGWESEERFLAVQDTLFRTLVLEPLGLPLHAYGQPHPQVRVELRLGDHAPIMLNRETASGYWDHHITEVTSDARMHFVRFFDWDQLAVRDNQYVRARIEAWPARPEVVGKHALIESRHVKFVDA